jgi:DNA segregation ATPase FtsK/SpoIIIE, S-DNA-T family
MFPSNPSKPAADATIIEWKLPDIADILDEGSAPKSNEEFIQQRARLIEDTLASFGAPAQVVAISRGPTITQFGVEPLFRRDPRRRAHESPREQDRIPFR